MKTQRSIYHLIVDRSGSMSDCIEATINGFNEQLNRIRGMESEFPEQEIKVGLTLFNDTIDHISMAETVAKMPYLSKRNYVPNGSTAFLDAIGQTSTLLAEREGSRSGLPTTFVVVVLTDGYENCSRMFNLEQVRAMIQRLEATGRWTFSFIGATLDAVDVARQMSIKAQNSFHFEKDSMKSEVWDKLSTSMRGYFSKKRSGKDLSDFFGS
ncbi:MAG: vWA domain-containing protein [Snowella sp.]|nr:vWA domain-containing protein [Snowella sp.]